MLDDLYAAGVAVSVVGLMVGAVLAVMGSEDLRRLWRRPVMVRRRLRNDRADAALHPIDHLFE